MNFLATFFGAMLGVFGGRSASRNPGGCGCAVLIAVAVAIYLAISLLNFLLSLGQPPVR